MSRQQSSPGSFGRSFFIPLLFEVVWPLASRAPPSAPRAESPGADGEERSMPALRLLPRASEELQLNLPRMRTEWSDTFDSFGVSSHRAQTSARAYARGA